ncbi:hypothetical protein BC829DRAFT_448321 [Chytridium lagenaria]|nr:hypothetical protein BC829DRAFT_448321 [Chytridium lagenaria]
MGLASADTVDGTIITQDSPEVHVATGNNNNDGIDELLSESTDWYQRLTKNLERLSRGRGATVQDRFTMRVGGRRVGYGFLPPPRAPSRQESSAKWAHSTHSSSFARRENWLQREREHNMRLELMGRHQAMEIDTIAQDAAAINNPSPASNLGWFGEQDFSECDGDVPTIINTVDPWPSHRSANKAAAYAAAKQSGINDFNKFRMPLLWCFLQHYVNREIDVMNPHPWDGAPRSCNSCLDVPMRKYHISLVTRCGIEEIQSTFCFDHHVPINLIEMGFMPNSVTSPKVAFSLAKMHRVARYREHIGVSFQAALEAEFSLRADTVKWLHDGERPPFYEEFLDASAGMDISYQASSKNTGQEEQCVFAWGEQTTAKAEYMMNTIPNTEMNTRNLSCTSKFVAGGEENRSSSRTEVAAILGTFCRHEVSGLVCDIDVSKKLMYAVSAVEDLRARYPNRKNRTKLRYHDVSKKLIFMSKHWLNPYMMMLPKLYAYCHDHGCQLMFMPQVLMGLGHFDGEGCTRRWSLLSSVIGYSTHQTVGNRRLTISLAMDSADFPKVASAPRIISKNLSDCLHCLFKLSLKHVIQDISSRKMMYKDAITVNWKNQHEMYKTFKAKRKISKIGKQLRLAIEIEVASLCRTTMTAKLRVKLRRHTADILGLLKDYSTGTEEI